STHRDGPHAPDPGASGEHQASGGGGHALRGGRAAGPGALLPARAPHRVSAAHHGGGDWGGVSPGAGTGGVAGKVVDRGEAVRVLRVRKRRAGCEGSRIALGRTASGRSPPVIYFPDPEPDRVFGIAAYEHTGKSLAAYRRRRKKKRQ